MSRNYEWVKVKDSKPEQFVLIALDPAVPPKDSWLHVGPPVTEAELRSNLKNNGLSEAEIDALLERARSLEA